MSAQDTAGTARGGMTMSDESVCKSRGAAILVEEHVLTAEARAALDIGRRGLR